MYFKKKAFILLHCSTDSEKDSLKNGGMQVQAQNLKSTLDFFCFYFRQAQCYDYYV
jgi:hypothetical protein